MPRKSRFLHATAASTTCLIVFAQGVAAQQKRVEYDISFPNAAQHEARVTATFIGVPPGTILRAHMSRSSPGRYALATFAKNVYDVTATDARGRVLRIDRPDSHGWNIAGHNGTVRIQYKVWGDRIDGTYLSIDHSHAHINMPSAFMWANGMEAAPIRLSIVPQPGWRIATQLVPTADSLVFSAPNLQWFMDSPTEVGPVTWRTWSTSFDGKPSTWRLAVHHLGTEAQVDSFATMAKSVVSESIAMWGETAGYDFGTYTFIGDYVPWATGDGMEHRNSTFLSSRTGLDGRVQRMSNLESLSHELFHSWNMERLRSKEIEPFDFDREDMSSALWFGEGFTNYYGPLILRRAGFYADSEYVALLGGAIVSTINSPARQHGSPLDMSRQAVFFDGGSYLDPTTRQNIFLSYYTWGSVVAAGLDLTLRARFHSTLDQYMRLMWQDYGRHQSKALAPERPYTVQDLRAELAKLTKDRAFADDFFRRYIEGREVPDFATLLAPAGLTLVKDSVMHPYFGASMDNDQKGVLINSSGSTGSAFMAGLSSGDIVVAIDGQPTTSIDVLNAILAKHHVSDIVKVDLLEKGQIRNSVQMALKGLPSLKVMTYETAGIPVTDAIRTFRREWLGSRVAK